jgi:polyisoprenoid-binding protein YceI
MNRRTFLTRLLITGIFLFKGMTGNAFAEDSEDLCAPFQDGRIDDAVVSTMLTAAEAGYLYRIQASTSQVGFCVDSKFQRVEGVFRDFRGGMALPPEEGASAQTVVAIRVDSLDTEGALIENLIRSPRFFDVENYPEILFVSTGFEWTSPTRGILRGNLTLHGVTKPVDFKVQLSGSDGKQVGEAENILVKATTAINRSDFGMDTLSSIVSDSVRLCMSVRAKKYHDT